MSSFSILVIGVDNHSFNSCFLRHIVGLGLGLRLVIYIFILLCLDGLLSPGIITILSLIKLLELSISLPIFITCLCGNLNLYLSLLFISLRCEIVPGCRYCIPGDICFLFILVLISILELELEIEIEIELNIIPSIQSIS